MGDKIYTVGIGRHQLSDYRICVLTNSVSEIKNTFTKQLIKRWNATTYKHFTGTIRHTYTQQTTQHTVVATFQFF